MYPKIYSCTRWPGIGLEAPGVLQIESIASFWFTRAPVAPTTPSELGDRAFLVDETPQFGEKVSEGANS